MFLVTGATGLVGRPLVDLLVAESARVRAVTRDPQAAALPDGVEVVGGDPSQPATLGSALRGVTGLFVNPRSVGRAADELLALAREAGVRRVVAMSALNVDYDFDLQPSRLRGEFNKEVEAAAVASGLEWTALRSGYYAMNAARSWASQRLSPVKWCTKAPCSSRRLVCQAAGWSSSTVSVGAPTARLALMTSSPR